MATSEQVIEEFDDLGFTLDNPQIVDRLVAMCDIYHFPEDKVACEYLAYLNQKRIPINRSPTMEILESFENECLKVLVSNKNKKQKGPIIYNSLNLPQHTTYKETYTEDDDEDGDLDGYYGANEKTPVRSKQAKREASPNDKDVANKKRLGEPNSDISVYDSPVNTHYKDIDISNTPSSQSQKYSSRTNAGKVLIRFGNGGNALPPSTWNTKDSTFIPEVKIQSSTINRKEYRYMFERLREKAGYLDEIICKIGEIIVESNELSEPQSVHQVTQEPFHVIGRICCDSDGRLNSKSIVLQGSQDVCLGRSIPVDAMKVSDYPLFPGQIVAAEVTNPSGKKLIANKFYSNASGHIDSGRIKLTEHEELQVVVACGPYTTSDNLSYEPLEDLLKYVENQKPHIVILCGPFVDAKHVMIDGCSCEAPFEAIFGSIMKKVVGLLAVLPNTQILVVPSGSRDVHHTFVYPTPPFEEAQSCNRIHMMTDPCVVNIAGITFGITSTDILFQLGKEEMSLPRAGDKLRRLATHLVEQRSFYPLYPPSEDINIDYEQLERIACLDVQPHVLILPSDFQHFFKDVNGCFVMNPQRLTRGDGGNVFSRMVIRGPSSETKDFSTQVCAEIVRI